MKICAAIVMLVVFSGAGCNSSKKNSSTSPAAKTSSAGSKDAGSSKVGESGKTLISYVVESDSGVCIETHYKDISADATLDASGPKKGTCPVSVKIGSATASILKTCEKKMDTEDYVATIHILSKRLEGGKVVDVDAASVEFICNSLTDPNAEVTPVITETDSEVPEEIDPAASEP